MDWKKTLLISFIILLAGSAITALIFNTEPTASRSGATQQTAMLVNVTDVERATHQPTIRAMGTVEPAQDIVLSPRVGGEITRRSDAFTPGGYVQKGDVLLQIDPADYKNALQQRQSELRQALADLNLEMGQQRAAQKEYQSYGDTLSEQNKQLALRKPQLESVQSRVESARAAVRQAELALERTTIRATFDAHILSRNVNVGSQVAPGENLGRLVGLDTFWIEATVPVSQLRWLSFPDDNRPQSKVIIRNQSAWGPNTTREGHLYKLIGSLEGQTRMARVLIAVPDPYGYHSDTPGVPNLIIGSFVEVRINTKPLPDVIRLNRDYIRDEETVWTMEEGKLRIKEVDIAFNDAQYAYISSGIDEDDQIVTTNLSTVADGAALRVAESDTTSTTNTTP